MDKSITGVQPQKLRQTPQTGLLPQVLQHNLVSQTLVPPMGAQINQ